LNSSLTARLDSLYCDIILVTPGRACWPECSSNNKPKHPPWGDVFLNQYKVLKNYASKIPLDMVKSIWDVPDKFRKRLERFKVVKA